MSTAENKQLLRRYFEELFNRGNLSVADAIVAEQYRNHDALPGEAPGREGQKQWATTLRAAVPDVHFTIEDQVAEGDKVVTRWTVAGTSKGELFGIPPTGQHVQVTGTNIHRVVDGQIAEAWMNWDMLGMLQQAGVIPSAEGWRGREQGEGRRRS